MAAFHELLVGMEKPGRLLAGDKKTGRQPLLIGPAVEFRGDGA